MTLTLLSAWKDEGGELTLGGDLAIFSKDFLN